MSTLRYFVVRDANAELKSEYPKEIIAAIIEVDGEQIKLVGDAWNSIRNLVGKVIQKFESVRSNKNFSITRIIDIKPGQKGYVQAFFENLKRDGFVLQEYKVKH